MPDKIRALRDNLPSMLADPVTATAAYAISRGVPLPKLLEVTGLGLAELIEPKRRLPEALMPKVMRLLAEHCPGEAVSLKVVESAPPTLPGVLLDVASLAPDLRAALRVASRFAALLSTSVTLRLEETDELARLCFQHPSDALDDGLGAEVGLGLAARVISDQLGFEGALLRVEFTHAPHGPVAEYRAFFGVPVRFRAQVNALVLRRAALGFAVNPGAGERLRAGIALLQQAQDALVGAEEPEALRAAREATARSAAEGDYSIKSVARRLGLGPRTLQRQLADFDTSPRELIEAAREANARSLLSDPRLTILEIALMLDYSTESAFRRAFRRWTGESPGAWRRRALRGG